MEKRRTKNTNTESGAIDYCKKVAGTRRYYSFCPNCGWRGDCDELLFDVSEVVIEHVMKAAKRFLRKESRETFEKNIREKIEIMKSTKDLRACTENGFILQGSAEKEGTEANDIYKEIYEVVKAPEIGLNEEEKENLENNLKEIVDSPCEIKLQLVSSRENSAVTAAVNSGGEYPKILSRRYCPKCKKDGQVSSNSGCYPEIVVALLGGPRVSKTTTICATIHALKEGQIHGKEITVLFDSDEELTKKWSIINSDENGPLQKYRKNQRVGSTDTAKKEGIACSFLVGIGRKKVLVSVIDIAGEHFRALATNATGSNSKVVNEILNSYTAKYKLVDYLWICIDASTLICQTVQDNDKNEQVGEALGYNGEGEDENKGKDENKPQMTEFTELNLIINSFNKVLLRRDENYKLKGAALIWGKIDQYPKEDKRDVEDRKPSAVLENWKSYIDMYMSNYNNGYGVIETGSVLVAAMITGQSSIIEDKLNHFGGQDLIEAVKAKTDGRACVFATSNYGHKPGEGKTIEPFNTMLPLLWMIAMEGGMKVIINRKDKTRGLAGRLRGLLGSNSGEVPTELSSETDKKEYLCKI